MASEATTTAPTRERSLEDVLRSKKTALEETVAYYEKRFESLRPAPTSHHKRLQTQCLLAQQDYQLQVDVLDQVLFDWESGAGQGGAKAKARRSQEELGGD